VDNGEVFAIVFPANVTSASPTVFCFDQGKRNTRYTRFHNSRTAVVDVTQLALSAVCFCCIKLTVNDQVEILPLLAPTSTPPSPKFPSMDNWLK
jgi:hypothetical protein